METTEKDLIELQGMNVAELCRRHLELFGEAPRCRHRQFLVREIAWKLQAAREGGLPEEMKQYTLAIARNCALRIRIADNAARRRNGQCLDETVTTKVAPTHNPRLPISGSLLIKDFKGQTYVVKVLDEGFEFEGKRYRSLSAIAGEITGTKWNGFLFFGLTKENNNARQATGRRRVR